MTENCDGASPDAVRQKFQAWIESRGVKHNKSSRYRYCLLIDEDVLENLSRLPEPSADGYPLEWLVVCVKVIDVEIDGERDADYPRGYKCCITTPPWMLAHIYFWCHDIEAEEMQDDYRGVPIYAMAEDGAWNKADVEWAHLDDRDDGNGEAAESTCISPKPVWVGTELAARMELGHLDGSDGRTPRRDPSALWNVSELGHHWAALV